MTSAMYARASPRVLMLSNLAAMAACSTGVPAESSISAFFMMASTPGRLPFSGTGCRSIIA